MKRNYRQQGQNNQKRSGSMTDQFQITFNLDADSVNDTFIDINNTGGKY